MANCRETQQGRAGLAGLQAGGLEQVESIGPRAGDLKGAFFNDRPRRPGAGPGVFGGDAAGERQRIGSDVRASGERGETEGEQRGETA